MNSKNIIYALIDPRTKKIRYVGQSIHGIRRAREHTLLTGRVFSEETRAKMRASQRRRFNREKAQRGES
ncbi:MAG: hypothetical protein KGI71_05735, partial [Patescibacteria group bacterium]|nr:hypothetical protein [Patescibacteria group bacterium]